MPIAPHLAQGIDISAHNGVFNPSKATERIDFVIARSNIGSRKDTLFDKNYQVSAVHNIPFMSYNQAWATTPWKAQADVTISAMTGKDVLGTWWAWDGAGGNKLTRQFAKDSVTAMSYLKQQTGKFVGVYGNRTEIAQLYKWEPAAKAFPLWYANYRATTDFNMAYWNSTPDVQPIYGPEFNASLPWLVWQYASEKNWLGFDEGHRYGLQSHSVDINAWRGTPAEMRAYLGLYGGNDVFDGFELRENPELKAHLRFEERLSKLEAEAKKNGWSV